MTRDDDDWLMSPKSEVPTVLEMARVAARSCDDQAAHVTGVLVMVESVERIHV